MNMLEKQIQLDKLSYHGNHSRFLICKTIAEYDHIALTDSLYFPKFTQDSNLVSPHKAAQFMHVVLEKDHLNRGSLGGFT